MAEPVTASLATMYQERLLDEYRAPKNRRVMIDATAHAERKNPVCGDAITVMVRVADGRVADVSFTGHGCSIAMASASQVVGNACRGREADGRRRLLSGTSGNIRSACRCTRTLEVSSLPARHGCVLMPWLALRRRSGSCVALPSR
jgi:nitrogen fixation NifU-like protein